MIFYRDCLFANIYVRFVCYKIKKNLNRYNREDSDFLPMDENIFSFIPGIILEISLDKEKGNFV